MVEILQLARTRNRSIILLRQGVELFTLTPGKMGFLLSAGMPVGISNMNGVGPHSHKATMSIFGMVIRPRRN
jgi:hypothetical protein